MSEHPLTRQTVSVYWTFPRSDEVQSDASHLILEEPVLPSAQTGPSGTKSRDRWVGISCLTVVGVILAFSVYSIVKYLL